ncbi:hypothetical protein PG989_009698 [Apiospora arundinis]
MHAFRAYLSIFFALSAAAAGGGNKTANDVAATLKAVGEYKSVSLICREGEGDDGPPNGTEFQGLWAMASLLSGDFPSTATSSRTASSAATSSAPLSAPFTPTSTTSSPPAAI